MGAVAAAPSVRDVRAALDRWGPDPAAFTHDVLQYTPWNRQAEFLRAVAANDFVAIRSGHKCSKSTSLATLAHWWLCTRPRARVVFTAPSNHQVVNIVWPEFRRLYNGARYPLGGRLYDDAHKGLKFADGREAFGLTTDSPERFAGLSGANLLFLVDEASGFPEPIFDAVFGNLAGGGKVVLAGNPTRTSGTFFDAFHTKRDSWKRLHIASTETPNFHGGNIPGLATPAWVTWAKGVWGADSPIFDVRVKGDFPSQGENAVIGLHLVEEAVARWASEPDDGPLRCGLDVARFGDDESILAVRRGRKVLPLIVVPPGDGPDTAAEVAKRVKAMRRPGEAKPVVNVDAIGVGASAYDALRRDRDLEVHAVQTSERADEEEEFPNLRSQLVFGVATFLSEGGALPPDDGKLETELVAPIYGFDSRGRRRVESKDDIKKRLKRSPDRADAVGLCVYNVPSLRVTLPTKPAQPSRYARGGARGIGL